MSAASPIALEKRTSFDVGEVPQAEVDGLLFDHFVGAQQELFRNGQTDRFRRRVIDDKVELDRLLDWDVGRLRTAQNLVNVVCGPSKQVREVRSVRQQTSGHNVFPKRV